MKKICVLVTGLLLILGATQSAVLAQSDEKILFTVDDTEVPVSEFQYIYEKTNGEEADYSRESLEEYLDLYTKFKLKVARAYDMGLDTVPSLQRELAGYRRQLSNSYLIDREVTEKLVREAYERIQEDRHVSHIMVSAASESSPADTLDAYNRILAMKTRLEKGEDFATLASRYSEDRSSRQNNGEIGWVTALLPNGFYELETAIYETPVGEYSGPVRTTMGYHLVKVNEKRPARGEMEVAHILIRKGEDPKAAKVIIDSLYSELQNGADFEELAKMRSQDRMTAPRGGYLGFFGINRYEKSFENAAFSLESDGDYTEPVESTIGWHIIKRVSKREIPEYEKAKRGLQARISKNERYELAKNALIEDIRKDAGFRDFRHVLMAYATKLGDDFLTYRWRRPDTLSEEPLMVIGEDYTVTLGDFQQYLQRHPRERTRQGKNVAPKDVAVDIYEDFVKESILQYEESRLPEKYPEFRNLIREYEEGILLFEATKREVWDKAATDSAGLVAYYEKNKGQYTWDERAKITEFTIASMDEKLTEKIHKKARKWSVERLTDKWSKEGLIQATEKTVDKTKHPMLVSTKWGEGALSPLQQDRKSGTTKFIRIEEILPQRVKALDEARGYVIADFQDQLEKNWVKELRAAYEIDINEDAFESLVRE